MVEQTKKTDIYQGCYGSKVQPSKVKNWIIKNIISNIERKKSGENRISLSVWGPPGISKTSIIKQLVNEEIDFNGEKKNIKVIDIPLAQIEEMGDVLGFPVEEIELKYKTETYDGETKCSHSSFEYKWVKAIDTIIKSHLEKGWVLTNFKRTTYAPPAWVPTESCPGIILFDDGNRASQRIMKGLMQLIQDYRTISWEIPDGWTICFTGNPDNKYNQVTSMDTAQLTRMKHISLLFDVKEWAIWANNNGIDERGINFMLKYPEMAIGKERTNPRSLTEFFHSLKNYKDLSNIEQLNDCLIDANASLDEDTVTVLTTFLTRDNELVISPEMILEDSNTTKKLVDSLLEEIKNDAGETIRQPRIDIISVTIDRLMTFMFSDNYSFKKEHIDNFKKFIMNESIPKDIVYATLNDMANSGKFKWRSKFICDDSIMTMVMNMYKKD